MALLILALACSAVDRSIISVVVEPIRREFSLSDSQLGLVTGMAFSIANAFVSLPVGLAADRVNRKTLMAVALAIWSVMTVLCGLSATYWQLLLARMGVGAAEAGGQSTSLSIVADLYPEARRATAVGSLYVAYPLGGMLASGVGGVVASIYGWRSALLLAGAPGLILAVGLMVLGRHPRREVTHQAPAAAAPRLGEILRYMAAQKSMLHLLAAGSLVTLVVSGQEVFAFAFFMRTHHMNLRQLGPIIGLAQGVFGAAAFMGGGVLSDWIGRRDPRARLWVIAGAVCGSSLLMAGSYLGPPRWALALYLAHILLIFVWTGPTMAMIQNLTRPSMRGSVAAVMYTLNGVMGFGLGPLAVGFVSDQVAPWVNGGSLRVSLLLFDLVGFWATVHFGFATVTLADDLARVGASRFTTPGIGN